MRSISGGRWRRSRARRRGSSSAGCPSSPRARGEALEVIRRAACGPRRSRCLRSGCLSLEGAGIGPVGSRSSILTAPGDAMGPFGSRWSVVIRSTTPCWPSPRSRRRGNSGLAGRTKPPSVAAWRKTEWPGRLQIVRGSAADHPGWGTQPGRRRKSWPTFLDGAPRGAWPADPGLRCPARTRTGRRCWDASAPLADEIILTHPPTARGADPAALRSAARGRARTTGGCGARRGSGAGPFDGRCCGHHPGGRFAVHRGRRAPHPAPSSLNGDQPG